MLHIMCSPWRLKRDVQEEHISKMSTISSVNGSLRRCSSQDSSKTFGGVWYVENKCMYCAVGCPLLIRGPCTCRVLYAERLSRLFLYISWGGLACGAGRVY